MSYHALNILDVIENEGLGVAENIIAAYQCPINKEIQDFLWYKSIDFARQKISITYFVVNDDEELMGYFALANKTTRIPTANLSKQVQKKLRRYGTYDEASASFQVSAYLLAQFGRNFNKELTEKPSGTLLMNIATQIAQNVQRLIGGGILFLECEDVKELLDFYGANGYAKFDNRLSESGVNYHQLYRLF
ncbi:MAG: hypothetical protein J5746_06525 [Victivallales bacterium]|nr:hypothetical protein [Victivallales bacterium]